MRKINTFSITKVKYFLYKISKFQHLPIWGTGIRKQIALLGAWLILLEMLLVIPEPHTGSFAQNSFQIDLINSCSTSKKLQFWLKIVKIIYFLTLKPIKGKLGFILEIMKKIARWRHKSEISKRNVKTMISPLIFHL